MSRVVQHEPFGDYLLLRPLGRGGMGVVYIARGRNSEHPIVALKRLRADAAAVPSFRERFEHECTLALMLEHPNVVRTLDAGLVGNTPYVASQLVRGHDIGRIAERLTERGEGAPYGVAIRVMLDVLTGLNYVHSAREPGGQWLRLVHRDVTPGNVLVGYDGTCLLADFGLAKSYLSEDLALTAEGMLIGTPKFMAPEVVMGGPAGPQADVYGLGAVIYRLLTGEGPYEGSQREVVMAILDRPPPPIAKARPDLPDWLASFIERMMKRDAEKRPESAAALAIELERLALDRGALVSASRLGAWLAALFSEERAEEDLRLSVERKIDPVAAPAAPATRVLRGPGHTLVGDDLSVSLGRADPGELSAAGAPTMLGQKPSAGWSQRTDPGQLRGASGPSPARDAILEQAGNTDRATAVMVSPASVPRPHVVAAGPLVAVAARPSVLDADTVDPRPASVEISGFDADEMPAFLPLPGLEDGAEPTAEAPLPGSSKEQSDELPSTFAEGGRGDGMAWDDPTARADPDAHPTFEGPGIPWPADAPHPEDAAPRRPKTAEAPRRTSNPGPLASAPRRAAVMPSPAVATASFEGREGAPRRAPDAAEAAKVSPRSPTVPPPESLMTARGPARGTSEAVAAAPPRRSWKAGVAIALLAAALGIAGSRIYFDRDDRVELAERLGEARRAVQARQTEGAELSPETHAKLDRVKAILLERGDPVEAELLLQDVELALSR